MHDLLRAPEVDNTTYFTLTRARVHTALQGVCIPNNAHIHVLYTYIVHIRILHMPPALQIAHTYRVLYRGGDPGYLPPRYIPPLKFYTTCTLNINIYMNTVPHFEWSPPIQFPSPAKILYNPMTYIRTVRVKRMKQTCRSGT